MSDNRDQNPDLLRNGENVVPVKDGVHAEPSPRQQQVLDILTGAPFYGRFVATVDALDTVAARIGWKTNSGVRDCLNALRAKGKLTRERDGKVMVWEVLPMVQPSTSAQPVQAVTF